MYHVVCVPLVAGFPFETLSYVSKKMYTIGTILPIQIGHQHQKGCVISCEDIRSHKLDIKSRDFLTKTLSAEPLGKLPAEMISWFFAVAESESEPYMNIWKGFLTNKVLEYITEGHYKLHSSGRDTADKLIIGDYAKRIRYYCDHSILPHLEHSRSILLISPTNESAKKLTGELIACDLPVILVTKSLPEKTKQSLRTLRETPSVIVSTPQNFLAPAAYADIIIIDDTTSEHYRSNLRPRINLEHAITLWCKNTQTPLVYGTLIPSVEIVSKVKNNNGSIEVLPEESRTPLTQVILESDNQKKLTAFWEHFSNTIKSAHVQNKTTCIIAPGNALARRVVCRDCGSYVTCPLCKTIAELHTAPNRHFFCPSCKHEFPVRDHCDLCTGTSLEMYGIGISYLRELLPKELSGSIIEYDNTKEIEVIAPGTILLGTRGILSALPDKGIDTVWLITPDTILVSPPYDAYEYLIRIHKEAQSKARLHTYSITRVNLSFIAPLLSDNNKLLLWCEEESLIRKQAILPPFETYLLITGYVARKEYEKMWDYLHKESPEYVSMIPRFSFRESGLDEKLAHIKRSFEIPFTLIYKPLPDSQFEEQLATRFRFRIIARTKNPTYLDKEEALPGKNL